MKKTQSNKMLTFLAVALFALVMHATKFLPIFYTSQQHAYQTYSESHGGIALFMDFAFTHKFSDLESYMLQVATDTFLGGTPLVSNVHAESEEIKEAIAMPDNDPIVYIYATHSTETIAGTETEPGKAIPGDIYVTELARLMGDAFQAAGIPVFVETRDTQEVVNARGWDYYRSYEVSREILDSAMAAYPTLSYFIDIHRDATTGADATLTIDGKDYATIQLVVGTDHPAFDLNLALAKNVIAQLEIQVPGFTGPNTLRLQGGAGKNGIYNQDASPNAILFEIGGQDTSLEAAKNSIDVIVRAMGEIINP